MDRRAFIATLARGLMAAPLTLLAQPQSRLARIGFLAAGSASTRVQQPFLQGMRELGLVEGRDFAVGKSLWSDKGGERHVFSERWVRQGQAWYTRSTGFVAPEMGWIAPQVQNEKPQLPSAGR